MTFYEPFEKDINHFRDLFEISSRNNDFDGLLMVCAHRDMAGNFLRNSIDYLGELQ